MSARLFDGMRVLVTGGTGSLGRVLVRRLVSGSDGNAEKIIVFSRDEAKQHSMRVEYQQQRRAPTDEVIYHNFDRRLEFWIGDVRDPNSIGCALRDVDIVINAAAMKQVPTCEYFPYEAVRTNVEGAENIVLAIQKHNLPLQTVVGVSSDKACKPVNVMGMTKAIQERIFIQANMRCANVRFMCVRYGNVLASRGSVIPLFHEQIRNGGPVTITTPDMTRFLLSLEEAVDTIFAAIAEGKQGETWVPRARSARIVDVATALIGDRDIEQIITGIRPGEKIHEVLISEEEAHRVLERSRWYAIQPLLPELRGASEPGCLTAEYSSKDTVLDLESTRQLLRSRRLMPEDSLVLEGELLR